ncbi:unnamed protein product [Closterium sp. NIES-54]
MALPMGILTTPCCANSFASPTSTVSVLDMPEFPRTGLLFFAVVNPMFDISMYDIHAFFDPGIITFDKSVPFFVRYPHRGLPVPPPPPSPPLFLAPTPPPGPTPPVAPAHLGPAPSVDSGGACTRGAGAGARGTGTVGAGSGGAGAGGAGARGHGAGSTDTKGC